MAFSFLHRQIWAHHIHKELAVYKLRIVQVQDKGRRIMDQSARARTMSAVRWGHWQNSTVRESSEPWEPSVPDWAYKTPLGINLLTQLCPAYNVAAPVPHIPGSWGSQVAPTTWKWKQARLAWRQWKSHLLPLLWYVTHEVAQSVGMETSIGEQFWQRILQKKLGPHSAGWITHSSGFYGFCFLSLHV